MDYAILGLLQQEDRSGYNIRMVFETTALGEYSSSPGSIYPALKRMQTNGQIAKISAANKSAFYITKQGLQDLKQWLLESIRQEDVSKHQSVLLLKFAFMDTLLTVKQKDTFLKSFQSNLQIYLNELKNYKKKEFQGLKLHGKLAFEHGLASYKTTLRWCKMARLAIAKNKKS